MDWIRLTQDKDKWRVPVNAVLASGFIQMVENSLE
jgi:hypothetical protein